MIHPTVHLNGTSCDALLEGYTSAAESIRSAMRAMDDASPNARDYSQESFPYAVAEHTGRVDLLRRVLDDLVQLYEGVSDQ